MKHIYIAYNKGYLVKYCLQDFNIELDFGRIHEKKITTIEMTKMSGNYMLTGSLDSHVKIFDRRDGSLLKDIKEDCTKEVLCAKFTHNDEFCIIAYNLENIELRVGKEYFDTLIIKYDFQEEMKKLGNFGQKVTKDHEEDKKELLIEMMGLDEDHSDIITCMAITYDNSTLFTAGSGGELMEWDIPKISLLKKYRTENCGCDAINNMVITPDDKWLFTIGDDCAISAVDLCCGRAQNHKYAEFEDRCTSICITKDSKHLFIGTGDRKIYKYDIELKEILAVYKTGHTHTINHIVLPLM